MENLGWSGGAERKAEGPDAAVTAEGPVTPIMILIWTLFTPEAAKSPWL
jgi:hypothetical protein